MKPTRLSLAAATTIVLCLAASCDRQAVGQHPPVTRLAAESLSSGEFVRLIDRLSEPGGYFDTDNLISNETSYLHALSDLDELQVTGGAYIGVGPSQNFSYIARVRPSIAFIIDIRRDNLLQHLLFKALFSLSSTRVEYLCLLTGRPQPDDLGHWKSRTISDLVDYIDNTATTEASIRKALESTTDRITQMGVALDKEMLATIARFHREFIDAGLGLRFKSFNRPPRPDYPTLRQLLLETDRSGQQRSFLANEESFHIVKSLEDRNLVVPVVGDLAGPHALTAIGEYLEGLGRTVSSFYTSNVEFYLIRQGGFARFAEIVSGLPIDDRSVIIRSYFNRGFSARLPQHVPGYNSTQLTQKIDTFVDSYERGLFRSYWDLVSSGH